MKKILLLTLVLFSQIGISQVLESDSLALVAFYNSANGDNWDNNYGWLSDSVQNWHGITIDSSRVTEIKLNNNNLIGTIPIEIESLSKLKVFNIEVNNITSIPIEFYNCAEIRVFRVNANNIDTIYPSIGELSYLEELVLGGNNINNLPIEIFSLYELRFLNFAANGINTIPAEIGNLTNLENFQFFENNIENIPSEIEYCSELSYINGYSNDIDTLPISLMNMSQIETLFLWYNSLSFEDIEPLEGITGFDYQYQDSIGKSIDTTLIMGDDFIFELVTGGEYNNYQWKKDDSILEGQNQAILELYNISAIDSGKYICEITNNLVTDLTLFSYPINIKTIHTNSIIESNVSDSFAISLFPNPAKDYILIKQIQNNKILSDFIEVFIYDITGLVVKQKKIYSNNKSIKIDINGLSVGIYSVQVTIDNKKSYVKKLIKY